MNDLREIAKRMLDTNGSELVLPADQRALAESYLKLTEPRVEQPTASQQVRAELAKVDAAKASEPWMVKELLAEIDSLAASLRVAAEALRAEITVVCECDGADTGAGPGVGVIDSERSSFDHGADAYTGAGDVITEYFDCPCAPLRAALAAVVIPEEEKC